MDELKQAANLVPKSVDKAVENLTDPVTKEAGTTFGDIWFLVFGGIHEAAEKKRLKVANNLNKFKDELTNAVDAIPPEHRQAPKLQLVGPALEQSKYCVEEEEIRKLFVNLISRSLDDRYSTELHPSFPGIVSQLSPLDAKILSLFKPDSASDEPQSFPLVEYQAITSPGRYMTLMTNVFFHEALSTAYDSYATSITSLERFGLIEVTYSRILADDSIYETDFHKILETVLQSHCEAKMALDPSFQFTGITREEGLMSLTSFGEAFLKVCLD